MSGVSLEGQLHAWALDHRGVTVERADLVAEARRRNPLLPHAEAEAVAGHVLDRMRGLGPIEAVLGDPEVTEVMVNGPGPVWVERAGVVQRSGVVIDEHALGRAIERMVAPLGRRLDRSSPLVDGRLPDGSRFHVAVPPVAVDGPYLTIRRFSVAPIGVDAFTEPRVGGRLIDAVARRRNVVVSGATASGKTTLLNALAQHIPATERVVTIEDAAELRLGADHVVRLESRPASVDGPAPIAVRDLVRAALRMRPDRIVVGEVRGAEALDMVQAMNTGHDGSLSTVHANGPADAVRRLVSMILMEGSIGSAALAGELVRSAVDVVVHLGRRSDGTRHVAEVVELPVGADARVS